MKKQIIRQIAENSIKAIISLRKKGLDNYSIDFIEDEIDLRKEIICSDPRDAKGNESQYFEYYKYYIWGLELGFREIEMLMGRKSLADRIVEVEKNNFWEQYKEGFTNFSHVIEERITGETGVKEGSSIRVYELTFDQWADLAQLSLE